MSIASASHQRSSHARSVTHHSLLITHYSITQHSLLVEEPSRQRTRGDAEDRAGGARGEDRQANDLFDGEVSGGDEREQRADSRCRVERLQRRDDTEDREGENAPRDGRRGLAI